MNFFFAYLLSKNALMSIFLFEYHIRFYCRYVKKISICRYIIDFVGTIIQYDGLCMYQQNLSRIIGGIMGVGH